MKPIILYTSLVNEQGKIQKFYRKMTITTQKRTNKNREVGLYKKINTGHENVIKVLVLYKYYTSLCIMNIC